MTRRSRDSSPSGDSGGGGRAVMIVAAAVAALFVISLFAAPYYWTQTWWELRSWMFWIIPMFLVVALAIAALAAKDTGARVGWAVLAVAALLGTGMWMYVYNYQQDRVYLEAATVTADPVPELADRTSYTVANAQVNDALGGDAGNVADTPTYVPDGARFTTLVEARGWFTGYASVLEQTAGTGGRTVPRSCAFDTAQAGKRLEGWLGGNLGRAINSEQRGVNWSTTDAYGYCTADGTPMVVVPLKEQNGFLIVTEAPAGVALYNGRTGALDIRPDGVGLPGPSYPMSLAAEQRASTPSINGFGGWWNDSAGWELADDDANAANASEFVRATAPAEGDPTPPSTVYVTPQTVRGTATSISAMTIVPATMAPGGQLAPMVVHRLSPQWLSPGSITSRVRGDFGTEFARNREADVQEVAPRNGHTWVVTIGAPKNMLYRVVGPGDLNDNTALCLYALDGKQIRCAPTPAQVQAGAAAAPAPAAPGPAGPPAPAGDLTGMSDAQLAAEVRRVNAEAARINEEAARRLAPAGTGG